jgi:hypothetical protein
MELFVLTAHAAQMVRERCIEDGWIWEVLAEPAVVLPDARDLTLSHLLRRIPENGDRMLRVVIDSTQIPRRVITLFFDRKASRELP